MAACAAKICRGVDQMLIETTADHLAGVDLNRNNPPFWASSQSSSNNSASLVFHGNAAFSEPETQALLGAADFLLPGSDSVNLGERLRMYIDVHSFTRILLPVRTFNTARNNNQAAVMQTLVNHHQSIPDGRVYDIGGLPPAGVGIGVTPEYFANTFQVPAWTLEIEPGQDAGAEYGGFNNNNHDGFILPETEITRVRENMAASIAATVYHQSGPPAVLRSRIIDADSGLLLASTTVGEAADDSTIAVRTRDTRRP